MQDADLKEWMEGVEYFLNRMMVWEGSQSYHYGKDWKARLNHLKELSSGCSVNLKWTCTSCDKKFDDPDTKCTDYHKREFVDTCPYCGGLNLQANFKVG